MTSRAPQAEAKPMTYRTPRNLGLGQRPIGHRFARPGASQAIGSLEARLRDPHFQAPFICVSMPPFSYENENETVNKHEHGHKTEHET
jgi:hypothetical protein